MASEHDISEPSSPLAHALSLAVHELTTPIGVISGYARMLLREQAGPLSDTQRKMLEEVERSGGRLGALVKELSEFRRLEVGEVALGQQEFDLGALVAEVASNMHEGEDRGIRLDVRRGNLSAWTADAVDMPVVGDRPRLSAVFQVLLRGVLRERIEPGTVIAACDAVTNAGGAWAIVAVGPAADIGDVIAYAAVAPAPSCDDWRGGLGLAVPNARRVIDAHGGTLWSGTFSLWPRINAQTQAVSALRLPLRKMPGGSRAAREKRD